MLSNAEADNEICDEHLIFGSTEDEARSLIIGFKSNLVEKFTIFLRQTFVELVSQHLRDCSLLQSTQIKQQ